MNIFLQFVFWATVVLGSCAVFASILALRIILQHKDKEYRKKHPEALTPEMPRATFLKRNILSSRQEEVTMSNDHILHTQLEGECTPEVKNTAIMSDYYIRPNPKVIKTGYFFALLLLVVVGFLLIVIGNVAFAQGSLPSVIFIGCGISMAPAAIVAALFRVFLFVEVQYQLTQPVIDEVKNTLVPQMRKDMTHIKEECCREIEMLQALRYAGILRPYKSREKALKDFASAIDDEKTEIMVIGSSLKGFLQKTIYKDTSSKLITKKNLGVQVKFILTHPVVADLRAGQEGRRTTEIGAEIIESLRILHEWGIPESNVRLYKGTPTVFAIKTTKKMFLNPYPYGATSYDFPCLIVEAGQSSYFYDEFMKAHFSAWDSTAAIPISNFDETIGELKGKLDHYADLIDQLLRA